MTTHQFMLTHAARAGNCEEVLYIIQSDPTITKFSALFEAIKHGHSACVDALLKHMNENDRGDVYEEGGLLLYIALESQQWDLFHKVFLLVDPEEFEPSLFSSAIRSGNIECFQALEPYLPDEWEMGVNIAVQHNNVAALECLLPKYGLEFGRALLAAIERFEQCPQMVDVLIPYASPTLLNQGLCHAVSRQPTVVPKLLTVCKPKDHDNEALKNALAYGQFEMAELLAVASDPQRVLIELLEHEPDAQAIEWLEEWIAQDLNARVHNHIEEGARENKLQRKI